MFEETQSPCDAPTRVRNGPTGRALMEGGGSPWGVASKASGAPSQSESNASSAESVLAWSWSGPSALLGKSTGLLASAADTM